MNKHQPRYFVFLFFLALVLLPESISAKDEWLQVHSKNFNLVGNASEKDIRKTAVKLEQFRESFRLLFSNSNVNAPIPTNVIVFKNNGSYKPFKPKRADGKIDDLIAGYFQSGEDVNYITLSTDADEAQTYGIIFHEYVHFIIDTNFGKSDVPPWFNEGLAEYYQTFEIEDDQKIKLGLPQNVHLDLLQQTKLIPLETLFKIDNYSLHQNGNHSRSIFYAQSWALIHYLIQNGKTSGLGRFLDHALKEPPTEKAFQDSFQMTYAEMEKELKKYVTSSKYKYSLITFKDKLVFDDVMAASPLSEAGANAYLGDLLYHTNRVDDAEEYLKKAIALEPNLSMANTTYGMVKIRQEKYSEATPFLEKAISEDQKNHLAFYYYAYLLSRADRNESGYVSSFSPEKSEKMRGLLKKSIASNPGFTESYELLAFINLVNNEKLDDAVGYLQTALKYQPGNQKYLIRIAEIYLRQDKFDDAVEIAGKIAATTDDPAVKDQAENLSQQIRRMREIAANRQKTQVQYPTDNEGGEFVRRGKDGKPLTPEEIAKADEEETLLSINISLKRPGEGEVQILGKIQKIECKGGSITYTVETETGTILLSSKDFQNLTLVTYASEANEARVGCGVDLTKITAVLTYKTVAPGKNGVRGELIAIDFVPPNFRFMEVPENPEVVISDLGSTPEEDEARRQIEMMEAMKRALREPQGNEKRGLGFIEKVECSSKGIFFFIKTESKTLKLWSTSPQAIDIRVFTPEVQQMTFGCGLKQLDVPVVFTYVEELKGKENSIGEIIAFEFVPKGFKL